MKNRMLVKMIFGSHLYGTETPTSDQDFKGVALPTWEQVVLGRIGKHIEHSSTGSANSRNTAEDVDVEIFTLHNFIKLALEGQTVAFDMLHAPLNKLIWSDFIWFDLVSNREKFYSKNINSFIGYAVGQAAKYGIKGSRLNAAKSVLEWFEGRLLDSKLMDNDLSTFPFGEHVRYLEPEAPLGQRQIDICGKRIQLTTKIGYAASIIDLFYRNYGERAKQAANDQGIDWKAISHAFRAAYQMKELYAEGTITFPRPEAEILRHIKTGQCHYVDVAPMLEDLLDEVRELKDKSSFPEKPDHKFWDGFLMEVIEKHLTPGR